MKVSVGKYVRLVGKVRSCGSVTEVVSVKLFRESMLRAMARNEGEKVKVLQTHYEDNRSPSLSCFRCMSDSGSEAHVCNDARIYIKGSEEECDVIISGVDDRNDQDSMHAYIKGDVWYRTGRDSVVKLVGVLFCPGADLGVTGKALSEPTVLISVKRMAGESNVGTHYLAGGEEFQHTDKGGKVIGSYRVSDSSLYVHEQRQSSMVMVVSERSGREEVLKRLALREAGRPDREQVLRRLAMKGDRKPDREEILKRLTMKETERPNREEILKRLALKETEKPNREEILKRLSMKETEGPGLGGISVRLAVEKAGEEGNEGKKNEKEVKEKEGK